MKNQKTIDRSNQGKYKLITDKITEPAVNDRELELDVLACMAFSEKNHGKIAMLDEHDFYSLDTREIFSILKKQFNEGGINLSILPQELKDYDCFLSIHNRNILTFKVDENIKKLREISDLRKIQDIAYRATVSATEGREPVEIKRQIESELGNIANAENEITDERLDEMFEDYLIRDEAPSIKTGFTKFDNITGGFMNGTMTIIASAQGIGKTSFVINLVNHMCGELKKRLLFVSLEMTFMSLYLRIVSNLCGVPYFKMLFNKSELSTGEWKKINEARAKISEYDLHRLGEKEVAVEDIRFKTKEVRPDIVMLDYMQLIMPENARGTIYENTTRISRGLKILAEEFNIPVIVISSINRDYSDRGDWTPRISDIRHSGQIEYDADMVLLLHRDAAFREFEYAKDKDEYLFKHGAELIIAKNRFGESNLKIDFFFDGERSVFKEMADYEPGR